MWRTVFGSIATLWKGISPGFKVFILGLVAGLLLLKGFSSYWRDTSQKDHIALQNAIAAGDSTRRITAHNDTVYARIIAQKDVALSGALRTVALSGGNKAKVGLGVTLTSRGLDTTSNHRSAASGDGNRTLSDSLVLAGPPVSGSVSVRVTDSTFYWAAKLRPSPVDLAVALTCGKTGPQVFVHGPPWLQTKINTGQVDTRVCHPVSSRWFSGVKTGVVVTGVTFAVLKIFGVIH